MSAAPHDLTVEVTDVRIDPPTAEVEWNCHAPAFLAPSIGRDHYKIHDGLIISLRTELLRHPVLRNEHESHEP